jgi:hypothetical protein
MGYGHAALPGGAAAPVMQLAEGIGDASGPAAGCEGVAPLMPDNAITMLSDDVVNAGSGDLTIGGVSDASAPVSVTLDNPLDAAGPVTIDAGPYRTRLTDPELRARLRTCSYEVAATPGTGRTSLGNPSRVGFKVVEG